MYEIFKEIVNLVELLGYTGLFIATLAEGTFIPLPNELTLIPAGILIAKGEFQLAPVLLCSIVGNLAGSLLSYYIAQIFGRKILLKFGKYVGFREDKMLKIENFFSKHGKISIFVGRIVPGIKHFISFPAGIAKMDIKTFCFYSGMGGGIWVTTLIILGMFVGKQEALLAKYTQQISVGVIIGAIIIAATYYFYNRITSKNQK